MSEKKIAEITVYRRVGRDPQDESWHKFVTDIVYNEFGGKPTLWNWAWIEYNVHRDMVQELIAELSVLGFEVNAGGDL